MAPISTVSFNKHSPDERYKLYCDIHEERDEILEEKVLLKRQNQELTETVFGMLKRNLEENTRLSSQTKDTMDQVIILLQQNAEMLKTKANDTLNTGPEAFKSMETIEKPKRPAKRLFHSIKNIIIGSSIVSEVSVDDLPGISVYIHIVEPPRKPNWKLWNSTNRKN